MRSTAPAWLIERPIAHRGLHDVAAGRPENSLSAAVAAIEARCSIECDIQPSRDSEAMVFHDEDLERLTGAHGRVDALEARSLVALHLNGGADHIATLTELLTAVAGRTPIVCEIKSRFDGDTRLAERAAIVARDYPGPFCFKSFDPIVMARLRSRRVPLGLVDTPLGMIAQADYSSPAAEWARLSDFDKTRLAQFLHWPETRPDFLSWNVDDLPNATPFLCRAALDLPVMAWTVRTPGQMAVQRQWTDQMVFEGFRP